jgi:endoglucanase
MKRTGWLARSIFVRTVIGWMALGWMAANVLAQPADPAPAAQAPPLRLNTIGYLPDAPKQATIARPAESFAIIRTRDGERVLEGPVTGPIRNEDTAEELYIADFSALMDPGEYRLEVPGAGQSPPFRIAADLYKEPFRTVTRAMYLMRCGTAVRGEHGEKVFEHAACHLDDGHLDLIVDARVPESARHRKVTGGWHDAGDYNKYVVNAGVTVGTMLRAWHDFQPNIEAVKLDLPESGGPLPELLAEVKWELDWLLKMQADDGSIYHKVSTPNYMGFVPPEAEEETRFLGEWGTQATASFVAMMAMAAREFRPYDAEFAARCLAAANKSYAFLASHPDYRRPGQQGFTTVGYDSSDWSARLWTAAELWETTGDAAALADFEGRANSQQPSRGSWRWNRGEEGEPRQPRTQYQFDANWDWGNPHNLGLIAYLESEREGRDPQLVAKVRESLLATADEIVAARNAHGYARPLGTRYFWGCNGTVARQVVVLEAARRVEAEPEYRTTSLDAINHLFGRNADGRSYVTGLGDRPPKYPHDRRSGADNVDEPWPGYVVGGPHPRAVDWRDEQDDYRTNEIAINWNAALIYALAATLEDANAAKKP